MLRNTVRKFTWAKHMQKIYIERDTRTYQRYTDMQSPIQTIIILWESGFGFACMTLRKWKGKISNHDIQFHVYIGLLYICMNYILCIMEHYNFNCFIIIHKSWYLGKYKSRILKNNRIVSRICTYSNSTKTYLFIYQSYHHQI